MEQDLQVEISEQTLVRSCKFTWTVKNISEILFEYLLSAEFCLDAHCESKWKLVLNYPYEDDVKFLKFGLRRVGDCTHSLITAETNFSVQNTNGTVFVARLIKADYRLNETSYCEPFPRPSNSKGVTLPHQNKPFRLARDDTLVIDGAIIASFSCTPKEPRILSVYEHQKILLSAYKEKLLTDFEFKVNGETIAAHKFILATRSKVFRTMLESGMMESEKNEVIITTIKKPILEYFLTYLYTGCIPSLNTSEAGDLYMVAAQYDVEDLKKVCRGILEIDLSEENIEAISDLAKRYDDKVLLEAVRRI